MINLTKLIEVIDADGTTIHNKDGKPPTLKEICQYALRTAIQPDQAQGFKEKNDRYLLLKRIDGVEEIELTEGEVKLVKERIGKVYLQVGLIGRAAELLDGQE